MNVLALKKISIPYRSLFWPLVYFLAVLANIIVMMSAQNNLSLATDWLTCFKPAVLQFISGQNPYAGGACFYNAPWLLIPFIPLAFLSDIPSVLLIWFIAVLCVIFVARKLGASPLTITILLLSPALGYELFVTNLNWLIAVGLILPPQFGLFLLLAKPQLGMVVALFWLVESWRTEGIRKVIKIFAPVALTLLVSLMIYGLWPLHAIWLKDSHWNVSMFPESIGIGLLLTYHALKSHKIGLAILASPFFAPYVGFHSWVFCLLGLAASPIETLLAVSGLWGFIIFRGGWHQL
jgi:hypothetical protein